jgi:S-adenosylmethionine:tRNA ribosyltransferase-isomerase
VYRLSDYQFDLPPELIAQYPIHPRDSSRLLVVDRKKQSFHETEFHALKEKLSPESLLVLNNTKVIPARLFGRRKTGGAVEVLLIKNLGEGRWQLFAKPGGKLKPGEVVIFDEQFALHILRTLEDGSKEGEFLFTGIFEEHLARLGTLPLPPYIRGGIAEEKDAETYQTVFAKNPGAVAAPTAGLHFTKELLSSFDTIEVTLHVGAGTFMPVKTEDIRDHKMHEESYFVSPASAAQFDRPLVAVGTTSCRVLESYTAPGYATTSIFIYPGYQFKRVSSLITNFHLPGSSLLMLVSAFGGYDLLREAYRYAIRERFRFFSYGDAMLIL